MFGIGHQELIVFLVIVLIIFGPKNLPKLAKSVGRAMRDFKTSLSGVDQELEETMDEVKKPIETHPVDTKASIETKESISTAESREPSERKAD